MINWAWVLSAAYVGIMLPWAAYWHAPLKKVREELDKTRWGIESLRNEYTRGQRIEREQRLLLLYNVGWTLVVLTPLWPIPAAFIAVNTVVSWVNRVRIYGGER